MKTFELIPELEKLIDILDAYKITASEIANGSDIHFETAKKCMSGNDNVSVKTYKRFIGAAMKIIEHRRERIEKYKLKGL